MKKAMLIKMVIGCIILTSGCGGDKTETTKKKEDRLPNATYWEDVLTEETLVEETITGW